MTRFVSAPKNYKPKDYLTLKCKPAGHKTKLLRAQAARFLGRRIKELNVNYDYLIEYEQCKRLGQKGHPGCCK